MAKATEATEPAEGKKKKSSLIKDFKAERKDRLLSFAVYINATSTFDETRGKTGSEFLISR